MTDLDKAITMLELQKQFDGGLSDEDERELQALQEKRDNGTADNNHNRYYCDACRSCEHKQTAVKLKTENKELQRQLAMALGNSGGYNW